MTALLVAPCNAAAARFAVKRWHYSGTLPVGKLVKFGVWEENEFVGAVIYGRGTNRYLGAPYGLSQLECCELVRVALSRHCSPVSQIVAQSIAKFKHITPSARLVVSFADPREGHHGGI